jgi:NADPH-dependent curcumin reductase CurA
MSRVPKGLPTPADFSADEVPLVLPNDGEFLSRTIFLLLDPHYRNVMKNSLIVVGDAIRAGIFHYREDISNGLASAPEAFCRLMRGENFGKASVRVAAV